MLVLRVTMGGRRLEEGGNKDHCNAVCQGAQTLKVLDVRHLGQRHSLKVKC